MKNDKFRRAFDNIDYTDEFKQKMRDKLSQPAEAASKTSDEDYSQSVEGVETVRRSGITRYVRPVAACLAAVVGIGAVGVAMKGSFNSDRDHLASRIDDIETYVETTSIPLTEGTTEIATEPVTVPTLDMLIDKNIPYTDLSEKSREELYEIGMRYFEAACELYLVNMGASVALDRDIDNGIEADNGVEYDLVQCEGLSSISDVETLYHSIFGGTWEFEDDFFREQDGRLYYFGLMAAPSNEYYEGWGLSLLEATDEKITYRVDAFFNDGAVGSGIEAVPLEFSLIPEDGVWKVDSFIYPVEAPFDVPVVNSINGSSSDGEIISYVRTFLTEADRNSYLLTSPYVDFEQYYDTIHGKIGMEELEEQGLAFFGSDFGDGWYYRVTNGKSKQELLDEHHSYFTEDYYDNFDYIVTERDGVAYVTSPPGHYAPFHDFEASADEITIKSQSDTEVIVEVAIDCTEVVVEYYQHNKVNSQLPEGYKYTYPQEIVLVNTEDGWRISDYIPYSDFRMRALLHCPEMQEYKTVAGDIIYNPLIVDNPEDFIGLWRVDGDEYGYELNVISADDTKVVFELSSYRSFGTSPITAEHLSGYGYFNTLGDDDNINIEGNLNLNTDGTIYLEITSSESSMVTVGTCITFNTKVQ